MFSSLFQLELSSSWKTVDVVSERDFLKQKGEQLGEKHRSRSVTFSSAPVVAPPPSKPFSVSQLNPVILSTSPLCIDAPEFRPRSSTLPTKTESHSLPTNIPSHLDKFADKRHKGSDRGKKPVRGTARFYPAISKENLGDKVRIIFLSPSSSTSEPLILCTNHYCYARVCFLPKGWVPLEGGGRSEFLAMDTIAPIYGALSGVKSPSSSRGLPIKWSLIQ